MHAQTLVNHFLGVRCVRSHAHRLSNRGEDTKVKGTRQVSPPPPPLFALSQFSGLSRSPEHAGKFPGPHSWFSTKKWPPVVRFSFRATPSRKHGFTFYVVANWRLVASCVEKALWALPLSIDWVVIVSSWTSLISRLRLFGLVIL